MEYEEPSLFDDWEAESEEIAAAEESARDAFKHALSYSPASCLSCREEHPSWQLTMHHATVRGECQGRYTVRNHVIYYALQKRAGKSVICAYDTYAHRKGDDLLTTAIERANAVRLDGEAIAADYATRPMSAECIELGHSSCADLACECGCTHAKRKVAA